MQLAEAIELEHYSSMPISEIESKRVEDIEAFKEYYLPSKSGKEAEIPGLD